MTAPAAQEPPAAKFRFLMVSDCFVEIDSTNGCFGALDLNTSSWSTASDNREVIARNLSLACLSNRPTA
jgi:hypothetical protein